MSLHLAHVSLLGIPSSASTLSHCAHSLTFGLFGRRLEAYFRRRWEIRQEESDEVDTVDGAGVIGSCIYQHTLSFADFLIGSSFIQFISSGLFPDVYPGSTFSYRSCCPLEVQCPLLFSLLIT